LEIEVKVASTDSFDSISDLAEERYTGGHLAPQIEVNVSYPHETKSLGYLWKSYVDEVHLGSSVEVDGASLDGYSVVVLGSFMSSEDGSATPQIRMRS
jgi:dihydroorotate dehydrogenase